MKTQFDINEVLESGKIQNELQFERALIADRKLRVLAKKDSKLKAVRKKLRDLIEAYENVNWSASSKISDKKLRESDLAEMIAEKERIFINKRTEILKGKLKRLNMTQQDLGVLLDHSSKSYMSELVNGVCPFSLKDL
ncbi:MAG: transcriptional regulator, partial [Bacteroidetes bacterium]|nr:transcriptional regulator [Bacteroidota bacterium]